MKRIRFALLSCLLLFGGVFFSACQSVPKDASLTLSATNVVLYLDEDRVGEQTINVVPQKFSPDKLDLSYDPSNITVTPSQKLQDGSFNLLITNKTIIGCDPVLVEVSANGVKTSFYVEVVVSISSITANQNIYVAYNDEKTELDLHSQLNFYPEETIQKNVNFEIVSEEDSDLAYIEGNNLVLESGYKNFSAPIRVRAVSAVNSKISAEFDVLVVPNPKLLAHLIDVEIEYAGTPNENVYPINIVFDQDTNKYYAEKFNVHITIPKNLGIIVDLDKNVGNSNAQHISNVLNCNKVVTDSGENFVYSFNFTTEAPSQGTGVLRFVYSNEQFDDSALVANFVGILNGEDIVDSLTVKALMQIEEIKVESNALVSNNGAYLVYNRYDVSRLGSSFKFVALPTGTSQTALYLKTEQDNKLVIYDKNGKEIVFDDYVYNFTAGEEFYIRFLADTEAGTVNRLLVGSLEDENVFNTINLICQNGGSELGFVDIVGDTNSVLEKQINLIAGDKGKQLYIYFPGGSLESFIGDPDMLYGHEEITIAPVPGEADYFSINFVITKPGDYTYTISTTNGFEITAKIKAIKKLAESDVVLTLKSESGLSGVGSLAYGKNGDLASLAIETGFSAELKYTNDNSAKIQKIDFGYYEPQFGVDGDLASVYDENLAELKDVDSEMVKNLTYDLQCNVLNMHYLAEMNLISAIKSGVVVVRFQIYGETINDLSGEIELEIVTTKYLFIQSYQSVKTIYAQTTNVELYAQNQVTLADYDKTTATINLMAKSNSQSNATYNKLFILGGEIKTIEPEGEGEPYLVCVYEEDTYSFVYNYATGELTITAIKYIKDEISIVVAGGDFIDFGAGLLPYYTFEALSTAGGGNGVGATKTITLKFKEAKPVSDISVTNLKLEDNTAYKYYETIYIDTLNNANPSFKLFTKIEPSDAFNKELNYELDESLLEILTVSKDGIISYVGNKGGSGTLKITAKLPGADLKPIIIPIIVADGTSHKTAYEITALDQITNPNGHYVLTTPTTYILSSTLLFDKNTGSYLEFNGGLYGQKWSQTDSQLKATIRLEGNALFESIGARGVIKGLNLTGDVTGAGFVAEQNKGLIENVDVVPFGINGIYAPSLLTVSADVTLAGGLVGKNEGTINNCSFAGSVKANDGSVGAIYGNNTGVVSNCTFVEAKYENVKVNLDRTNLGEDDSFRVNGLLNASLTFVDVDVPNSGVALKSYKSANIILASDLVLNGNDERLLALEKTGIIYRYESQNANSQKLVDDYNIFTILDLFALAGGSVLPADELNNLTLVALNADDTICSFVEVNGGYLKLLGTGEFKLVVSSKFDYTQKITFELLCVNYFSNFRVLSGNTGATNIEIVDGATKQISTAIDSVKDDVLLKTNKFDVKFAFADAQITLDISKYITGNSLGNHTINTLGLWADLEQATGQKCDSVSVVASLHCGYGSKYDSLLNQQYTFTITKKIGTTALTANISEGQIEPKDALIFEVDLVTDILSDKIDASLIKIININNYECGQYFDIVVNHIVDTKYEIIVALKQENRNNLDLVDKVYAIIIKAGNFENTLVYECETRVRLTILAQSIASINTTMYETTYRENGVVYSNVKGQPTSVIKPNESGLFAIEMFPTYATFDYLEVVAESNTISKLSFRPQRQLEGGTFKQDYLANYEALEGANGVRLFNKYKDQNTFEAIGTYYIKLFVDSSFNDDTIFTITTRAYYQGELLEATSTFTLVVKMPDAPEFSIGGQTTIYSPLGQSIETDEIFISADQINPLLSVVALDGKDVDNIEAYLSYISTNNSLNTRRYSALVRFKDGYNAETDSTKFKLVLTSTYQDKGEQITVTSSVVVYCVDIVPSENFIQVFDANDQTINITSLTAKQIKLLVEKGNMSEETYSALLNTLYFNNEHTGLKFGKDKADLEYYGKYEDAAQDDINLMLYRLIDYLYYVEGNATMPISKFNAEYNFGEFVDNSIVKFYIKDGKLYVIGGSSVGTASLKLRIPFVMPDGVMSYYEYNFNIVNSSYTTEDLPVEIASVAEFKEIENNATAQDFILTKDLNLFDYVAIENTSKINSLDGNNHTINIFSYENAELSRDKFALFNEISSNTTIKNLTVNLYYLSQIDISTNVNPQIAGFAIVNNGIITNCDVLTFKSQSQSTTSMTYGIKVDAEVDAQIAGFVLENNGSITHSRVGGDEKLVTKVSYNNDKNQTYDVSKSIIEVQEFSIVASGTISGFVETNNGVIASSFVKNIKIDNRYNKNLTKATSGFVKTNNGQISLSYVQNGKTAEGLIQSNVGGLSASGEMAGFVYQNNGSIADTYANITLINSAQQSSRAGAGFVFKNSQDAIIERSYSFSTIKNGTITQLNFAGVTALSGGGLSYNNEGEIKNCYYYTADAGQEITIESLLNTSIVAISAVERTDSFYGFDFSGSNSTSGGTWGIDSNGPYLISANDISHSVRAKVENTMVNAKTDYAFVYCEDFELGTTSNPIIIRDAKEFVSVFGASSSTDIKNNYNLKLGKVYGAYRIVNNLDFIEFIPKDDQEESIISTQMTLSGENAKGSNRNGSINGNGLNITNFAISNHSLEGVKNFGLFKTLEQGASIKNLNIYLANGGVSADHTVFVGTVAGSIIDSTLANITLKAQVDDNGTLVIGANVVGAVAGRVSGNSVVSNIRVEDISVTATYHTSISRSSSLVDERNNLYSREEILNEYVSIAGGVFGAVDTFTEKNSDKPIDDQKFDNVIAIRNSGFMQIQGMTAGGVMGLAGEQVVAKDIALTLTKNARNSKIVAYNCYAGGIVGYNSGDLVQVRIEHEDLWQQDIEASMHDYYTIADSTNRQNVDRGIVKLFESDNSNYRPIAIGGLVGVMNYGKIDVAYSKVNVVNENATYSGGAIGFINNQAGDLVDVEDKLVATLKLVEIYATGDVYNKSGYVGGVIGYDNIGNNSGQVRAFNRITAMNYWGEDAFARFVNADPKVKSIINSQSPLGEESAKVCSLTQIQFADKGEAVRIFGDASMSGDDFLFMSYYKYSGVASDNGGQVDLMFFEKEWSKDNWDREIDEMFPHIVYTKVQNTHIIECVADLMKFIQFGGDKDAVFVVKAAIDTPKTSDIYPLIDCSRVNISYGTVRGTIIGQEPQNGFYGLNVPLLGRLSGAKVSELTFKECNAPIASEADGAITIADITFAKGDYSKARGGNLGAVVHSYTDEHNKMLVRNLRFVDCNMISSYANNAGFLVGNLGSGSTFEANGISFEGTTTHSHQPTNKDVNLGLVLGNSNGNVSLANIAVQDSVSLKLGTVGGGSSTRAIAEVASTSPPNIKAGLLAGNVSVLTVNMSGIHCDSPKDETSGNLIADLPGRFNAMNVYLGGIVAWCRTLTLTASAPTDNAKSQTLYYAPKIYTQGMSNLYSVNAGALAGYANNLSLSTTTEAQDVNTTFAFGALENETNVPTFVSYDYSLCSGENKTNNIGGACGQVNHMRSDNKTNLSFLGDMKISSSSDLSGNIGGVIGTAYNYAQDESNNTLDSAQKIRNIYFEGTISFKNITNTTANKFYVGGLVGLVQGETGVDNSIEIKNSIASGEISLNSGTSLTDTLNIGGLVGANSARLQINESIVITTITANINGDKSEIIDVITNDISRTEEAGGVSELKNVFYASNLTLSVTEIANARNVTLSKLTSAESSGYDENNNENESQFNTTSGLLKVSPSLKNMIENANTNAYLGSKFRPFKLNNHTGKVNEAEEDALKELTDSAMFGYETPSTSTVGSTYDSAVTIMSKLLRKVYVKVPDNGINSLEDANEMAVAEGDEEIIDKTRYLNFAQISLKNAVLFSDGGIIYSRNTILDEISASSVVAGVRVAIYMHNADADDEERSNYKSVAGFVNTNAGTIYTCGVQEVMLNGPDNSTQFYGVIKAKDSSDTNNLAGFVGKNIGYIFGSSTNVTIQAGKGYASGFVTVNNDGDKKGVIEYSYASGVILHNLGIDETTITLADTTIGNNLFTRTKTNPTDADAIATGTIKNCYTIMKAQYIRTGGDYRDDGTYADPEYYPSVRVYGGKWVDSDASSGDDTTGGGDDTSGDGGSSGGGTTPGGPGNKPDVPGLEVHSVRVRSSSTKDGKVVDTPSGVLADYYSSEVNVGETKDITADSFGDDNKYFAVFVGYNYGYPTISKGAFANLEYTKRSTQSIPAEKDYDLAEKAPTTDERYTQVPNLRRFLDIKSEKSNYVIIADIYVVGWPQDANKPENALNFKTLDGYNNNIYKINLEQYPWFVSATENESDAGQMYYKKANLFAEIIAGATLKRLHFKDVTLKNSNGIIGSNYGTIIDCSITGYFRIDGAKNKDGDLVNPDVIGGLVATNKDKGTLENCYVEAKVSTSGKLKVAFTFGGLVGNNEGSVYGTKTDGGSSLASAGSTDDDFGITRFEGSINIVEPKLKGQVVIGGLVGKNAGTIHTAMFTGDNSLKVERVDGHKIGEKYADDAYRTASGWASINAITGDTLIVGGIAGINQGKGIIKNSITKGYNDYYGILAGDEVHQLQTYAGGIAGRNMSALDEFGQEVWGSINNCANTMNIASMAIWKFITNNPEHNPETHKDDKDFSLPEYYYFEKIPEGEESPIEVIYSAVNNALLIYKEMISLAYAGGIVADGITEISTDGSYNLANYGKIAGGYRALKPCAALTHIKKEYLWLATLAELIIGFGLNFTAWGGLDAKLQLNTVINCSAEYYLKMGLKNYFYVIHNSINNLEKWINDKDLLGMSYWTNKTQVALQGCWETFILGDYSMWTSWFVYRGTIGWIVPKPKAEIDVSRDVIDSRFVYRNVNFQVSDEILYDTICKDLNENTTKVVSSESNYFSYNEYTKKYFLNTPLDIVNYEGDIYYSAYFPTGGDKAYNGKTPLPSDWKYKETDWVTDEDNLYVPPVGETENWGISDSETHGETVKYSINTDDRTITLKATLTDPNKWSGLVKTINQTNFEALWNGENPSNSVLKKEDRDKLEAWGGENGFEIKSGSDLLEKAKFKIVWDIQINLGSGARSINVQNHTINKFNGTLQGIGSTPITFNGATYTRVQSYVEDENEKFAVGLISIAENVTLRNIKLETPKTSIDDDSFTDNSVIVGGLIGLNVGTTKIENCSTKAFSLGRTGKIKTVGGMVGENAGVSSAGNPALTITNSNVDLSGGDIAGSSSNATATPKGEYAYGGVIGKNGANADIETLSVSGKLALISKFNNVGNVIGIGAESTTLNVKNLTAKINLKVLAFANELDTPPMNVAVGGLIGKNLGSAKTNITNSSITRFDLTDNILVSADSSVAKATVYAGGIAGYGGGIDVSDEDDREYGLILGDESMAGYSNLTYILAGYNTLTLGGKATVVSGNAGIVSGNGDSTGDIAKSYAYAKGLDLSGAGTALNVYYAYDLNDDNRTISLSNTATFDDGSTGGSTYEVKFNSYNATRISTVNGHTINDHYVTLKASLLGVNSSTAQTQLLLRAIRLNEQFSDQDRYIVQLIQTHYYYNSSFAGRPDLTTTNEGAVENVLLSVVVDFKTNMDPKIIEIDKLNVNKKNPGDDSSVTVFSGTDLAVTNGKYGLTPKNLEFVVVGGEIKLNLNYEETTLTAGADAGADEAGSYTTTTKQATLITLSKNNNLADGKKDETLESVVVSDDTTSAFDFKPYLTKYVNAVNADYKIGDKVELKFTDTGLYKAPTYKFNDTTYQNANITSYTTGNREYVIVSLGKKTLDGKYEITEHYYLAKISEGVATYYRQGESTFITNQTGYSAIMGINKSSNVFRFESLLPDIESVDLKAYSLNADYIGTGLKTLELTYTKYDCNQVFEIDSNKSYYNSKIYKVTNVYKGTIGFGNVNGTDKHYLSWVLDKSTQGKEPIKEQTGINFNGKYPNSNKLALTDTDKNNLKAMGILQEISGASAPAGWSSFNYLTLDSNIQSVIKNNCRGLTDANASTTLTIYGKKFIKNDEDAEETYYCVQYNNADHNSDDDEDPETEGTQKTFIVRVEGGSASKLSNSTILLPV